MELNRQKQNNREWNGIDGVWSSHICRNPAALNKQAFTEFLALCHWDERLVKAFQRASIEYIKAGSPGVPITSKDYRKQYKKVKTT